MSRPHISVCVCTYQRPALLLRLLRSLQEQRTDGQFEFSIVVIDNDATGSARPAIDAASNESPIPIAYGIETRRSISHARNAGLELARGEYIAIVDDDEFAEPDWLIRLWRLCIERNVAGVLGPVRPYFPPEAPKWVQRGGFYNRPEHPTGFEMPWALCRTGNLLFDRRIIAGVTPVFSPEFGTGGSDLDFFRRMTEKGHRFLWCNEAAVHELVASSRWRRRTMMQRALLRGGNSFRHPEGRAWGIGKALIALPIYGLFLPFSLLAGQHLFMKYLIKSCDHGGRLLAMFGIRPIRSRPM